MSYTTWINEGRGICTTDIKTTPEKIMAMLDNAPIFKAKVEAWMKENNTDDPCYYEGENGWPNSGLAYLMSEAILEAENVSLTADENYNGDQFLIYLRWYPWEEAASTYRRFKEEEELDDLYRKWVNMLTDIPIDIDDQRCENGD